MLSEKLHDDAIRDKSTWQGQPDALTVVFQKPLSDLFEQDGTEQFVEFDSYAGEKIGSLDS